MNEEEKERIKKIYEDIEIAKKELKEALEGQGIFKTVDKEKINKALKHLEPYEIKKKYYIKGRHEGSGVTIEKCNLTKQSLIWELEDILKDRLWVEELKEITYIYSEDDGHIDLDETELKLDFNVMVNVKKNGERII